MVNLFVPEHGAWSMSASYEWARRNRTKPRAAKREAEQRRALRSVKTSSSTPRRPREGPWEPRARLPSAMSCGPPPFATWLSSSSAAANGCFAVLFSLHCSICPVLYVLVCLSHCCLLWRRSCDCRAFAFRSSSGGYADVQVGEHGAARQGGEGQPPVFVAEQSSLRLSDIFRVVFVCSIDQLSFVKLRSGKARLRTNSFFFSLFFFLFFF